MISLRNIFHDTKAVITSGILTTALVATPVLYFAVNYSAIAQAQAHWIILSTYAAAPGQTFTVHGYGFQPGETVRFTFQSSVLNATAGGDGQAVSPNFTVPHVSAGSYPVTASGQSSGRSQTANIYVSGFYPVAQPSAYYILPGQQLGFSGQRYAPDEQVELKHNGTVIHTFMTDGAGAFDVSNVLTVPRAAMNSQLLYTLLGKKSGASFDVNVKVGRYYPQIRPSLYYVQHGTQFSVEGMNFAPNESVELYVAGMKVATANANDEGRVTFGSVTAPAIAGSTHVRGLGVDSDRESTRIIHVY